MAVHPWERERRARIEAALDFLLSEFGCRKLRRFIRSGGVEVFYWNVTTGVRAYVESREEFTVQLCPMPDLPFPPRFDNYGGQPEDRVVRRLGRREVGDRSQVWTQFSSEQRYGPDQAVIAAYAVALEGPCRPLLAGDAALWERLRRQRRARTASNVRRLAQP